MRTASYGSIQVRKCYLGKFWYSKIKIPLWVITYYKILICLPSLAPSFIFFYLTIKKTAEFFKLTCNSFKIKLLNCLLLKLKLLKFKLNLKIVIYLCEHLLPLIFKIVSLIIKIDVCFFNCNKFSKLELLIERIN